MTGTTDNIISLCIGGDKTAFRKLVELYQSYAFALALRLLCNEEDAKDVVQECFIRVWNHLSKFNPNNKFTTWLYRIVTNLCYDRLKMKKRRRKVISTGLDDEYPVESPTHHNVEYEYSNKELTKMIETLAEELKPKQRMVFILRDLQDLSMGEVSKIMGLSVSSVKSNLYHARQNIRKRLERMGIQDISKQ